MRKMLCLCLTLLLCLSLFAGCGKNTEPAGDAEDYCKAAFHELVDAEFLHYTYEIHINGELRTDLPRNEGWFFGEDWLLVSTADMPGAMRSQTIAEVDGVQYVVSGLGDEQTSPSCFYAGEFDAYGKKPIEDFINYDLEFVSESDTDDGKIYSFTVLTDGVKTDNLQSYIFDKAGHLTEARFESETVEVVMDGVPQLASQTVVYRFPEVSAEECRDAIDKAFYALTAENEAALSENNGSEQEQRCLAAIKKVLSTESARVSKMYGLGVITNRATLFYNATDWLLTDAGQGYSQSYLVVDGEGYACEQSGSNGVWYPLEALPAMPNLFGNMNYERQYTGREELENGYALCFIIDPVEAGLPNANEAVGETTESFLFNSNGEFYCLSRRMPLGMDAAGEEYIYIEELSVDFLFAKDINEAIKEEYEECINEIARREAAITENSVYDDGSDVISVPYGESVVIDLDGDGTDEVLCMEASEIYGIWSLTVNGVEYLDSLEMHIGDGDDLNPNPSQSPDYYVVRTYKGDYSPKICVYDDGPSGDPNTHFFTYNGSLQYHGSIPCHMSRLSLDGNHHLTGPARLSVFQTWYAEHTWLLPNNGSKVSEVERDFYYVDDFEFIYYPVDGVLIPPSKYSPLLCQVYAYRERDISAQPFVLEKGTQLSILGTDNKEWLLVADRAGREYYLHLCGINSYSVDTPAGEIMGNEVLGGLSYVD